MEAVIPSDAALVDGKIVPADFSGAYLLNIAVVRGGANSLRSLAVLEVVLLAGLVGMLATEVSGRQSAGVLAAILVAASPAVISAGIGVAMHDALAAGLLVAGILVAIRSNTPFWFIAAGICLGMSVLLRYPNILLLPVGAYFVQRYRAEPVRAVHVVASCSAIAVTIGTVAIPVHFWMYGDPFSIGSLLRVDLVERIGQGAEAHGGVFGRVWRYVTLYAIPSGLAAIALLGVAGLLHKENGLRTAVRATAMVSTLAICSAALFLLLSLGPNTYGIDSFRVNASVLRYLLPLQVLMSAAAAVWLRTRAMGVLTGSTLILAGSLIAIGFFGEGGVRDQQNYRALGHQAIQIAEHEFDHSRTTFVSRIDSLFWPMFHTLNPAHLGAGSPRDFGDTEFPHFYDGVAAPDLLAERMVAMAESGRGLALVEDPSWPDDDYLARVSEELRVRGYMSGDPIALGPGFRAFELHRLSVVDRSAGASITPLVEP